MIPLLFWMLEEKEHNKKRPLQTVLARSVYVSFGFSLLIELCQLFLKIGTFQLTDLFFNTLGGALGGLLYWGFDRSRKRAAAYIRKLGGWDTEEWNPPAEDSSRLPIIKAETADTEKEKTFVPVQEKTEGQQDHSTETDASWIPLTPEQEEEICTLIREAGQKMLHAKLSDDAVHEKDGPANFCTDFDMEIQKFLIQGLGRILPGAGVFR